MPSYAIVGTGAVGGLYGALLRRQGKEVHFLLRSDYEHVKRHGLRVDSPLGDMHLEGTGFYADPEAMPRCDVVVVAWKTTENRQLPRVLPTLVKPGGMVLVLQNGLDPEREAAAAAGDVRVMAGLCFLCSRREAPGWIRHLDHGAITLAAFAERGASGFTAEMQTVAADFREAGVEIRLETDWRRARWRKLVWNVPFNGLCALLGADTAQLMGDASNRSVIRSLMEEVLAGAEACACALPADFADRMLAATDAMAPYEPSMKLDRDFGRPMELEAIYGRTLEEIRRHGGSAPRMETLHAQLRYLEALNA